MKLHRSLIAAATSAGTLIVFTGIACTLVFTGVAHATSAPPDLSPEYTWMGTVDQAVAEAAEAAEATEAAPAVEYPSIATITETVIDSAPVMVVHEMTNPIGYHGPAITTGVPGGPVVADHAIEAIPGTDQRVLRCSGALSFGAGGIFPAASVAQPGLVDQWVAAGTCLVVG